MDWPGLSSSLDPQPIGSFPDPVSSSGCQRPLRVRSRSSVPRRKREDRSRAPVGRGADAAVAWVTVERGERDAQRFWLHVIDALADAAGDEVVERVSPAPRFAARWWSSDS